MKTKFVLDIEKSTQKLDMILYAFNCRISLDSVHQLEFLSGNQY